MRITLDHEMILQVCDHCKQTVTISRGSVFEGTDGVAIYLAAMHACGSGRLVDLAVAIREGYKHAAETAAIAIKVRPTSTEIRMNVANMEESFWKTEEYLGKLMDRQEAMASPLIETFFHIADHIVRDVPEISSYLEDA